MTEPRTIRAGDAHSAERTESRPCPVCDAVGGAELLRHDRWRLVGCAGCGLPYMPEYPTDEAIDTEFEWSESFKRERMERWMRNPFARAWTMSVLFMKPSREARALRWIRRSAPPTIAVDGSLGATPSELHATRAAPSGTRAAPSGTEVPSGTRRARMIDVGCGDGRLPALALRWGYDAIGVEPSPKMASRAARRMGAERVLCGRLADFDLERGSFDLAVTVSYLEHEPRPAPVLRRLFELLRPGGVTVHKTPNYDCLLRRVLGARWSGYRWPEHVQYFSPATLGRLIVNVGFEVISVKANPLSDNFWIAARKPTDLS
ncbi:MAG: Ubiquinone biosynthesis O-methyltransferase [Phycisphaerae bacterium]|nr:Ubiquinone biosynthesis O-methyltransferase [Phycisphaerae bacterium]